MKLWSELLGSVFGIFLIKPRPGRGNVEMRSFTLCPTKIVGCGQGQTKQDMFFIAGPAAKLLHLNAMKKGSSCECGDDKSS
jgi:hypothetical protein